MEHVAAIMMLVGCGSAGTDCSEIPAPAIAFETVAACRAELQPALDAARPRFKVTYGLCEAVDPALLMADATIVWEVTPAGELTVSVTDEDAEAPLLVAEKGARPTVYSN
ncbi:hypothetical protein [Pararhizobium antarcticum]|uniref:Uncharacterized protein n=1 Tax=Pararhizobium antarcticum TaxID=1798805 RepID=A0A657LV59_9HYPH|nr:hypothetical protein [Pararhizobium antarcticum]OJF97256.1 hypothetical protein AX761_15225 [Rhizobium sp. 58]OJF99072.1 hypothetical protein AX760_13915 [Pararhizobium antarcticum]